MRAATWNIRKGIGLDWRRSPERIMRVLAELEADIVCLQEADRRFGGRRAVLSETALAEETGLHVAPLPDRAESLGWHGNVLLTSARAELHDIRRIALPCAEPRGALMAELTLEGRRLRVVGVHLGLRRRDRARQAAAIVAALADAATRDETTPGGVIEIVAGDLNAWRPHDPALRAFERRLSAAPARPSFHTSAPMAPLDRIFVNGARIAAHGVHASATARRASDHLPVWCRIEAGPPPPVDAARLEDSA